MPQNIDDFYLHVISLALPLRKSLSITEKGKRVLDITEYVANNEGIKMGDLEKKFNKADVDSADEAGLIYDAEPPTDQRSAFIRFISKDEFMAFIGE